MYNKLIIIGRLGSDPEIRYTKEQKAVASMSVATTETFKDKATGQRKDRTEWHRVVMFGKLAEIAGEHLKKGALVLFEGPSRTRKWQGQDGIDRYTTELNAEKMKMMPSGQKNDTSNASPAPGQPASSPNSGPTPPPIPDYDDFDDDIPF